MRGSRQKPFAGRFDFRVSSEIREIFIPDAKIVEIAVNVYSQLFAELYVTFFVKRDGKFFNFGNFFQPLFI